MQLAFNKVERYDCICISIVIPCPKLACSEVDQVSLSHMAICHENTCFKVNQIMVANFFYIWENEKIEKAKIKSKMSKEKEWKEEHNGLSYDK